MEIPRHIRLKIDQLGVLVKKDFKLKYDSTALGMLWSVLTPLALSAVYWFVFGKMMRWGGDGSYALYVITGNFMWHYFSCVVNQCGTVLPSNASLLKKTSFDRKLLVWGTYLTETAHFVLTIPLVVALMWTFGIRLHPLECAANVAVALTAITFFSVGVGYFYAALDLRLKDCSRMMTVVMRMWLFASPVFIPMTRVPEQYRFVYDFNPMAQILIVWRDAFYAPAFHPERFLPLVGMSVAMFLAGRLFFTRNEPRFAEMM